MKSLLLFIYINFSIIYTQISHYGYPHYINEINKEDINVIHTNEYDIINNKNSSPLFFVFGNEYKVNINFFENANYFSTLGGNVYILQINSQSAKAISLEMDDFYLAPGVEMFIYNIDKTMIIGAFTSENNKNYNTFSTSLVKGDKIIIEVYVPGEMFQDSRINISKIIHDFTDLLKFHSNTTTDRNDCNINVACSVADPFQDQVNAVMLMTMGGGSCSASLINNVEEDLTPYVLTAQHCLGGNASNYNFYFKYQSNNCNGSSGSYSYSMSGSYLRSEGSGPDFALLELSNNVPESYDPFYNGWSRNTNSPDDVYGIHHAGGDIKKISFTEDDVASTYNYWEFEYDEGRIFPGSSGSPLFDQYNRTIGPSSYMVTDYCNGWNCYCDQQYDVGYGKLYRAWDYGSNASSRLKDWLDPNNSDIIYIDGISNSFSEEVNVISPNGDESWEMGTIQNITWLDNFDGQVSIKLYKDNVYITSINTSTLSDGNYEWSISEAYIPGDDYKIKITSLDDPSIYDLSNESFSITGVQGQVLLNIDNINVNEEYIDILMNNSVEIAGFQFKIVDIPNSIDIEGAFGGISEEYEFLVSSNQDGTVLGFSLTGESIPPGENILTKVYYSVSNYEEINLCIEDGIFSSADAIGLPVTYGNCIELNLNYIILGDINFDNQIDIFDVIMLINEIMDPGLFDDNQFTISDFNYDNVLDILDIIALVNTILY